MQNANYFMQLSYRHSENDRILLLSRQTFLSQYAKQLPEYDQYAGADPGFQVRGKALKQIIGVFRGENHDFTPKNHISFKFKGRGAGCVPWIRPCYGR